MTAAGRATKDGEEGNVVQTKTSSTALDARPPTKGIVGGLGVENAAPKLPRPAPLPPRPVGMPVPAPARGEDATSPAGAHLAVTATSPAGAHLAVTATGPAGAHLAVTATSKPEEPQSDRQPERTVETATDGLLLDAEEPASSERTDVQRKSVAVPRR
ncbi:MAG: hypothetical protein QM784_27430 [Polyangiaceae bacterium]